MTDHTDDIRERFAQAEDVAPDPDLSVPEATPEIPTQMNMPIDSGGLNTIKDATTPTTMTEIRDSSSAERSASAGDFLI